MRYRDEILRGVRLAAIVLALLLLALVLRRMIRVEPAEAVSSGPVSAVRPAAVPSKPVIESGSMTPGSNPPPPPPPGERHTAKDATKNPAKKSTTSYQPPKLVRMEPASSVERTAVVR